MVKATTISIIRELEEIGGTGAHLEKEHQIISTGDLDERSSNLGYEIYDRFNVLI